MTERTRKFSSELDRLIKDGSLLDFAMQRDCYGSEFDKKMLSHFGGDKKKLDEFIRKLPHFRSEYQKWYSEAQAVIKYVLPHRLDDFISFYEYQKPRKSISFHNYMIRDFLQGLQMTNYVGDITVDGSAAIPEFRQQTSILGAAKATLDSVLIDLKSILQADLFDSEIESAQALAKAGYLRAAGAICGVVIEKHLLHICRTHKISIAKKNPSISDLNQALRDKSITTVPQWRFVQHLADIRNICDHAKGREPTKEEIESLVSGSEKVLKTVF